MSAKTESNEYPLNWLRWLVVILLVAGGIVANSVYGDYSILYRVVGLVALGCYSDLDSCKHSARCGSLEHTERIAN